MTTTNIFKNGFKIFRGTVIWVKVFKNGPSKISGRQPLKTFKLYGLRTLTFFKGSLPQILLGPFLHALTHVDCSFWKRIWPTFKLCQRFALRWKKFTCLIFDVFLRSNIRGIAKAMWRTSRFYSLYEVWRQLRYMKNQLQEETLTSFLTF